MVVESSGMKLGLEKEIDPSVIVKLARGKLR